MPKVKMEGHAEIGIIQIVAICKHCSHHERDNGIVYLDGPNNKMYFSCPQCKKTTDLVFSGIAPNAPPPPLPRTRIGR